ncbi:MAG: HYR domain-containing protein [Saprospiraceae bacterium]|nr:HYR domain-containing protein [Saprospiraceae bacterium]
MNKFLRQISIFVLVMVILPMTALQAQLTLSSSSVSSMAACGDNVVISIKAESGFTDIGSLQFSVNWDPSKLEYVSNVPVTIDDDDPAIGTGIGNLTFTWFDSDFAPYGASLSNGTEILTLTLKVISSPATLTVDITSTPTVMEATDNSFGDVTVIPDNNVSINVNSGPVHNFTQNLYYCNIQDAIDDADDNDEINVSAGVYNITSPITVNKSVTINGPQAGQDPRTAAPMPRMPGSASEAIVDGGGTVDTIFNIIVAGVILNGLEVRGGARDLIASAPGTPVKTGVTVKYCIVHGSSTDEGIQLRNVNGGGVEYCLVYDVKGDGINLCCGSTNSFVQHNEIYDSESVDAVIYLYDNGPNMLVDNNLLYDNPAAVGIMVGNKGGSNANSNSMFLNNAIISNNVVIGNGSTVNIGIYVNTSRVNVTNNEVTDCGSTADAAVYFRWGIKEIVATGNKIHDGYNGIKISSGVSNADIPSFSIQNNSFDNNTNLHIWNSKTAFLPAICNWLGSTDLATNTAKISGPVTFVPFLSSGSDLQPLVVGFQPSVSCGNNVVIDSAEPTAQTCSALGEIEVNFSGGVAPYSITWTGGGPVNNIPNPYAISLTTGTYTITVTSANGTTATAMATVDYLPVTNVSDIPNTYYATIQAAVTAADPNEIIEVCAGNYSETINVNKNLTINGPNDGVAGTAVRAAEAVLLDGKLNILGNHTVVVDGFHIYQTNTTTPVSLGGGTVATIQNSIIERVGVVTGSTVRGIEISNGAGVKNIKNNKFTGSTSGGLFGGHVTWNSGMFINGPASVINIEDNLFENSRTALNIDDMGSGITLDGNTFDNNGTHISFGGMSATSGSYTFGANDFKLPASVIINLSNVTTSFRLDISAGTWEGTSFGLLSDATLFGIEAGMYHRSRSGRNGLVTYKTNNQYVIPVNNSIQLAVDYAPASGHTINVASGTNYPANISVNGKSLTIQGQGCDVVTGTTIDGLGTALNGISVLTNTSGVIIKNLVIKNTIGGSNDAGIRVHPGCNGLLIEGVCLVNTAGRGAIYVDGPVNGVNIEDCEVSGTGVNGRGITVWNGFKENISITNNYVHDIGGCCGIELQDGNASGVIMEDNTVENIEDSGMSAIGLNETTGSNSISDNIITNTGRYGIEIKNPNGGGTNTVISGNTITGPTTTPLSVTNKVKDFAGIAVFRRSVGAGNVNVPTGVRVINNTVSGYRQTSVSEGFGIVVEGTNHTVTGNTLEDNDVAIQLQAGHTPAPPGDGSDANVADFYFGRGNSPELCNIDTLTTLNNYTMNDVNFVRVVTGGGVGTIQTDISSITPTVDNPGDQTLCVGKNTNAVNFTGNNLTGVVYNWTNTNTSIGLAASGSGNIASFTGLNTTGTVQTGIITVTPVVNGCEGTPEVFTISVQPSPVVSATVTGPAGPGQVMTSGAGPYFMTICSGQEVTTSDATSTSIDPATCGPLWVQTTYLTDISTLPNTLQTFNAPVLPNLGPTSITPENHDGAAKDIEFVSTPYYDFDNSGTLTPGDIVGTPIVFTITVLPTPKINFIVTADGTPIPMESGLAGTSASYAATICSGELVSSTAAMSMDIDPAACGPLMIQTSYSTTISNIFPQNYTAYGPYDGNVAPASITPQNLDGIPKTIVFTTTPFYDVNGNNVYDAGIDVVGDYPVIFTLTIQPAPVLICPASVTVNNDPTLCSAIVSYATPTYTDYCPVSTLTQTLGLASGSAFPVGVTTNTWQLTDAATPANVTTCSFTVTVVDNEFPTSTIPGMGAAIAGYACGGPPINLFTDPSSCNSFKNVIKPVWADNCGITSSSATTNNMTSISDFGGSDVQINFPNGTTILTFTASDAAMNSTSCVLTIVVADNVAPVFNSMPPDITVTAPYGDCSAIVSWLPPTASDNCPGTVTITSTHSPGSSFLVGTTTEVIYTAKDGDNNMAMDTFYVTVNGFCIPPVELTSATNIPLIGGESFVNGEMKDIVFTVNNIGANDSHELLPIGNVQVLIGFPSTTIFTTMFNAMETMDNNDWDVTDYGTGMSLFTLKTGEFIPAGGSKTITIKFTAEGTQRQSGKTTARIYNGSGGDINSSNNYTEGALKIN